MYYLVIISIKDISLLYKMTLLNVMGSEVIPPTVKVVSAEQEIEGTNRERIVEAFRLGDALYKGSGTYDLYFGFVHGHGMQFLYHYPKGS
jgi:hypothetical protein